MTLSRCASIGCSVCQRLVGRVVALASTSALLMGLPGIPHASGAEVLVSGRAALASLQDAFAHVADVVEPAVVTVSSFKVVNGLDTDTPVPRRAGSAPLDMGRRKSTGTGTGVLIRKDGWILTNDHVVAGADRVSVRLHDGREYPGRVVRDPRSDLALVKIEEKGDFPVAQLGDSDKVKVGHWAIAIGSPYKFEGSLSVGVISSLQRRQVIFDSTPGGRQRLYPDMIQTDAAINPGNSGGPLCNVDGEVIGINTAIESDHGGLGGGSIGIGFAIPINSARYVVSQLMDKGRVTYGYLGVSPTPVTPRLATALKVEFGALLEEEPGADTPAGKAGLRAGDVVVAIDGKPVHNEIDLRTIVSQTAPRSQVAIDVVREGAPVKLHATLEEAEAHDVPSARSRPQAHASLGIQVAPLARGVTLTAGPTAEHGVVVKAIDKNSAAAESDELSEGCVILKLNGVVTPTVESFKTVTAGLKPGDQVRIFYLRPPDQRDPGRRFLVLDVN